MTSYFQDGGHDVISQKDAAVWWVHTQHLPGADVQNVNTVTS